MKRSYFFGGVFLLLREKRKLPDGGFLLNAAAAWIISAAAALIVATLIANLAGMGERGLAYLSSAVSFIAATAAGLTTARKSTSAAFLSALLTATVLVITLLTVGFLVKTEEMDPSAILSIVSFTYAGVLFGMFIHPRKKTAGKRRHFT